MNRIHPVLYLEIYIDSNCLYKNEGHHHLVNQRHSNINVIDICYKILIGILPDKSFQDN